MYSMHYVIVTVVLAVRDAEFSEFITIVLVSVCQIYLYFWKVRLNKMAGIIVFDMLSIILLLKERNIVKKQ